MKSKPWVLGLASSHNGAACLLHGECVVAAIQEERLLRMKRAELLAGESSLAIRYCLDAAGIKASDLNMVVNCPTEPFRSIWMDLSLNPVLRTEHHRIPTLTISHHLGHAVGAFVQSGFRDSAVLVVDASGSRWDDLSEEERATVSQRQMDTCVASQAPATAETISLYHASGVTVTPIRKWVFAKRREQYRGMRPFRSLGEMYSSVGRQIFGSFSDGPGKVMGLAPYGCPRIPVSDFFEICDGEFNYTDGVVERFPHNDRWPLRQEEYRDLAASTQEALEHALMFLIGELRRANSSPNLCFAGGTALNSVANEKIVRQKTFESCFFMPAAEDSGTAIGAAYYGLWKLTGEGRTDALREDSAGRRYAKEEISAAIVSAPGLVASESDDIVGDTVRELTSGQIVGWFEGGSELGPRALGHRSILCDPRDPEAKERLNNRVKFRESFRPFAPCVLLEAVSDWFDVEKGAEESPFMMRVMAFRPEKAHLVPAVVHVDGTGRVQTVTQSTPRLYALVKRFYSGTGVPMLLNTSFNIAGEPIVESPEDAIWCFLESGMDRCVLENFMLAKEGGYGALLDSVVRLRMEQVSVCVNVRDGFWRENGDGAGTGQPFFFSSDADSRLAELELAERYPSLRLSGIYTKFVTKNTWGRTKVIANCDLRPILSLCSEPRTVREILLMLQSNGHSMDEAAIVRLIASLRRMSLVSLTRAGERASATDI